MAKGPRSGGGYPLSWHLLPFAGLWFMACCGLAVHWGSNPQYQYGWFVPVLAVFAAMRRWQTRPIPGTPLRGGTWLIALTALVVPAVWLFLQPNPDWALTNWLFVLLVALITFAAVGLAGGRAWINHFFWPTVLLFAAIPWPDQIENPLMQHLMRTAASLGVGVLDFLGVPAIQHGNLIEVAGGVVGVDEACSGIRSLQGSLMSAIYLGELFTFSLGRRFLLVGISLVLAFSTNVVRVSFLAWNAAQSGLGAVDKWHDPAGLVILAICVTAILLVALFMDRNSGAVKILAQVPPSSALPRWIVPSLTLWVGVTVLGTELWYRETAPPPQPKWSVTMPAGSKPIAIPSNAQSQLRYDTARGAQWAETNGQRWLVYFFDWNYGPAFARVAGRLHNPAICLPASGRELVGQREEVPFTVNGETLLFQGYAFNEDGRQLFVYHGVWQFRSERGREHGELHYSKHIASMQSVLWRERFIGQQSAEIAVWGCANQAEADSAFQKLLPTLVHARASAPSGPL